MDAAAAGAAVLGPDDVLPGVVDVVTEGKVEAVFEKMVVGDSARSIELHHVRDLEHSDGMILAFLPKEKILINADLYVPPAPGAPAPTVTGGMRTLQLNMKKLGFDVTQHVRDRVGVHHTLRATARQ